MLKNYFEVAEDTPVRKFLKEIKEKKHSLYIVLDTNPKSFVDVRTIALKAHNLDEKLKNFKKAFSKCKTTAPIDCLKQLIESGDRVIIDKEGNYFDFIDGLKVILDSNEEFLNNKLSDFNKKEEIFALNENDKISTARNLFIRERVNLLPIIDKNQKLVGEVRPIDFLVSDLFNPDNDKADYYDENKDNSVFNLPVENIANKVPKYLDKSRTVKEALNLMIEKKLPSIIVTDNENIFSIVSYKDIFKEYAPNLVVEDYVIEYVHPNDIYEDDLDFIKDLVERTFKKIRKVSDYDHLRVSFKTIGNTEGSHKIKLEVHLTLYKGNNSINISKEMVEGTADEIHNDRVKYRWNVPLLVKEALTALERKVFEEKKRH